MSYRQEPLKFYLLNSEMYITAVFYCPLQHRYANESFIAGHWDINSSNSCVSHDIGRFVYLEPEPVQW